MLALGGVGGPGFSSNRHSLSLALSQHAHMKVVPLLQVAWPPPTGGRAAARAPGAAQSWAQWCSTCPRHMCQEAYRYSKHEGFNQTQL